MSTTEETTYAAPWGEWQRAMKLAGNAASKRPTLPVLASARIGVTDDEICVVATDLERWIVTRLRGATGSGVMQVNIASLVLALKGIRGALTPKKAEPELVTVTDIGNGKVTIAGFGRTLTLDDATAVAEDFPSTPQQDFAPVADFRGASLTDSTAFARVAAGKDHTLPMLTGVLFDVTPQGVTLAATDRYRLAVTEAPAEVRATENLKLLVPTDALGLLAGMTDVHLAAHSGSYAGHARFSDALTTVYVRTLDSTFPSYAQLLPSRDEMNEWRGIDRKAVIADVSAAAAVLERRAPVQVTFGQGSLTVAGSQPVIADTPVTDGYLTAFNPQYLIDGLKAFGAERVTVGGTSAGKPHVLTDGSRKYLIMPVRIAA